MINSTNIDNIKGNEKKKIKNWKSLEIAKGRQSINIEK